MLVEKTQLDGALLIYPKTYEDERGLFYESWRSDAYKTAGIQETFVQDNVSANKKGVLRGLHFQKSMGQLVTVVKGTIFDVVVDIRKDSATFGQHITLELSKKNPAQLYMPAGMAHGFCVLTESAIINYKCTEYYDPTLEGGLSWNDPDLNINWPLKAPILSERDQNFPPLSVLKSEI